MPRKHSSTYGAAPAFHLYNRATAGAAVFRSDSDREHFRNLLSRYLMDEVGAGVGLIAYCLMTSHFHLIAVEHSPGGIARLMHRLMAAYVIYYRRKYGGSGPLFEGPYRRKPITNRKQLRWTIAYVHDNHPSGVTFRYSSHRYYLGDAPAWLDARSGLAAFGGELAYANYLDRRKTRKELDRAFF